MSRLVVVSNRVAPIQEGETATGGLAVAILAALEEEGGIWFGWSGEVVGAVPPKPDLTQIDRLTYATIGMTRRDRNEYYNGFANAVLWPLFHYRLDLVKFSRRNFAGYMRVNANFAKALYPLLRIDNLVWVHDYHLIPMGRELRRLGCRQPIGFFLHTPLPALEIMLALPRHEEIFRALCAYDLIGFQTANDLAAFHDYIVIEADGEVLDNGLVRAFGRTLRTGVFAIGIDTEEIEALAEEADRAGKRPRLMTTLQGRSMIIGVDRLDYSKGLVGRFRAFERMLEANPKKRGAVTFMQIAPALAVRCQRLWRYPPGAGDRRGQYQRPVRRFRLGADPLPQQEVRQAPAGVFLSRGSDRRGHAAARRDEPGRQGICRCPAGRRSRRPGAVAVRRRRTRARRRPDRQPVRPRRGGERLAPGARDAARRAPRTASDDAEPAASAHCPSLAQGVSRGARQPPA